MTTPILMLLLMTAPWLVARARSVAARRETDLRGAAAIGLGMLFAFTAVGHFAETARMTQMLPTWVPGRELLVYATGLLEFALALGFLVPGARRLAGVAAAALLVSFLPVNVHAAILRVPMGGHGWGPSYLLVRVPLQAIMFWWVHHFTLRRTEPVPDTAAATAVPT